MSEQQLTPELEAMIVQRIMENKPYLLAIEDAVQQAMDTSTPKGFGTVDIRLEMRGGKVEKVSTFSTSVWMRPKP